MYLVQDLKHARPVALKIMHPDLAAGLGPKRFLREIQLAARLDHPHILPVYDSGEAAGQLWYVMPYVEGESLRERLRREVRLPIRDAVRITREIAGALEYAHARDVVHRDIKPENILLAQGHARLTDFGIAKPVEIGDEALTRVGFAVGTPKYMSPEQASGEAVDPRSDLYSLACVLYEMLAGETPYTGPSAQAIIIRSALGPGATGPGCSPGRAGSTRDTDHPEPLPRARRPLRIRVRVRRGAGGEPFGPDSAAVPRRTQRFGGRLAGPRPRRLPAARVGRSIRDALGPRP